MKLWGGSGIEAMFLSTAMVATSWESLLGVAFVKNRFDGCEGETCILKSEASCSHCSFYVGQISAGLRRDRHAKTAWTAKGEPSVLQNTESRV
jgi:hypothetical protein